MKKQYVLSEEEYKDLVPKSELEALQKIIDRTTELCIKKAVKKKDCIEGGYREYCTSGEFPEDNCKYRNMCHSLMKKREKSWRKLDHMIE